MLDLLLNISSAIFGLIGFASVALTNQLNPLISLLGLASISIALLLFSFNIKPGISKPFWNIAIVMASLILLVDLFLMSGSLLISTIHLSVFLMINKLFDLNAKNDYTQLYLISLLQFLAAATMTERLFFAFIAISFLFIASWTLILFHLRYQIIERRIATLPKKILDLQFFFATNIILVAAFLITILIFFLIPRFGVGFLQKRSDNRLRTSGFSQRVDLGDIAPIKLDNSIVMRIRIQDYNDLIRDKVYWRGVTFDFYDGHSWRNNLVLQVNPEMNEKGEFLIGEGLNGKGFYQEIILEPLDTNVLFAASHVEALDIRPRSIKKDMMGSIYMPYAPFSRIQYSAYSRLDSIAEEDRLLESIDYPPAIKRVYLQLPDESKRIGALTRGITSSSKTIIDKINAVERYLEDNYRYTLDVKPPLEGSPIEDFLFRQKAGYCEYYATAMVIMLRGIGIPSRLITGFLAGEWNEIGGYLTVRQKDAHTWVEAYLPRSGWVTFDPTPPLKFNDQGSIISLFSKFIDSIRLRWDRYIIKYSLKDQVEAVKKTREKARSIQDGLLSLYESIRRYGHYIIDRIIGHNRILNRSLLSILAGSSLLFLIYLYLYIRKGYRIPLAYLRFRPDKDDQIVELYKRMLNLLESKGISKEKNITPLEFARGLYTTNEETSDLVLEATRIYYEIRYGHQPLSKGDLLKMDEIFLKIKKGSQAKLF